MMKQEKEFYIGYYPNAPKGIAKTIKIVVGILIVIVLLTTYIITRSEKQMPTSQFEYGTLTELEGVLYSHPVPMLRVLTGSDANGQAIYKSILLVNFLKHGAAPLLEAYQKQGVIEAQSLVKLRGTLIYHDGVTLMELTEQESALVSVKKNTTSIPTLEQSNLGEVQLKGEIVDSKCYFGVMKPGFGKPHRDCAIRCISGGIPPVLVVKNEHGEAEYMLLIGQNSEPINQQVLTFVGLPISIKGRLEKMADWYVLKANPIDIHLFTSL
jgi:hypothetical protein